MYVDFWSVIECRFNDAFAQLIQERDRLNKDLEEAHSAIKQLEAELDNLNYGRGTNRRWTDTLSVEYPWFFSWRTFPHLFPISVLQNLL